MTPNSKHQSAKQETDRLKMSALFARALIESNGNATEAAKHAFNLGSKGGKNIQRTAESMGSEYLRKPEVQRHLSELLDSAAMNRNWVFLRLKHFAEQTTDLHLALKSVTLVAQMLRLFPEDQMPLGKSGEPQRKTIFMLAPPSIPPGGVPTPALQKQWSEMGCWDPDWKPAYETKKEGGLSL